MISSSNATITPKVFKKQLEQFFYYAKIINYLPLLSDVNMGRVLWKIKLMVKVNRVRMQIYKVQ